MKKLAFIILFSLGLCGCLEKGVEPPMDLDGRWYGSLGKLWLTDENERYIMLTMNDGKVSVIPFYTSITSGWYEGEGSYIIDEKNIIRFDIKTDVPSFAVDHPDVTLKTITHAEIDESAAIGMLLKVYYEESANGQTETHILYFDRTQP